MTVCGIAKADGVCVMGECPYIKMCCPAVWDKSGKPMTNEEWLRQANTEQLAEFLNAIIRVAPYDELEPKSFWEHLHPYDGGKKGIVEWLKQPHTE